MSIEDHNGAQETEERQKTIWCPPGHRWKSYSLSPKTVPKKTVTPNSLNLTPVGLYYDPALVWRKGNVKDWSNFWLNWITRKSTHDWTTATQLQHPSRPTYRQFRYNTVSSLRIVVGMVMVHSADRTLRRSYRYRHQQHCFLTQTGRREYWDSRTCPSLHC